MSAEDHVKLSASEKKKEDWMNSKWRPMMGWLYMATCTFDFVIFPILWSLLQSVTKSSPMTQWQPLTLQGAGLYHIAMGAVLGLAAFGRTQEKLAGANNGGMQFPNNAGTTYIPPNANTQANINVSNQAAAPRNNFTSAPMSSQGFDSTPMPTSNVTVGYGGKKAPVPAFDPEL